ncbi:hypothetical protein KAR91_43725 [Candidatus Pacearchaeota archaeon]|nr:hypothetical protein [Candidatus Pacearchaeota archaeon]
MNCNKCFSRKVCFLQKQIENLADRMIQSPFHEKIDTGGDRTASMALRHTGAITKQDTVCRKLKEVIASNCPLYLYGKGSLAPR